MSLVNDVWLATGLIDFPEREVGSRDEPNLIETNKTKAASEAFISK